MLVDCIMSVLTNPQNSKEFGVDSSRIKGKHEPRMSILR
ncbi:MAG: hypothetical protein K0R75_4065 [Paenibacillaceae bacterium]|nr:hypothetical protein [Paenibacillaceae bacterium]